MFSKNGTLVFCSSCDLKKSQVYFCEELYTGSRTSHTGRTESLVKLALFDHGILMYFFRAVGRETGEYMNQTCSLLPTSVCSPGGPAYFLWKHFLFLRLGGKVRCKVICSVITYALLLSVCYCFRLQS